jgi:DNA-binding MurR/RpiR family transcriptional regulator
MKIELDKLIKNNDITKLEHQVLEYIINNINSVMKLGVRGVAKENFTSTSTIMRLSKKLGYDGFVDMVYNIMPLVNKSGSTSADITIGMEDINLESLLRYISEEDIKSFVKLLVSTKSRLVFIYATGFSRLIAEYLNNRLVIIGKKSVFGSGSDSIGIFENHLDDMDILVVISKSGETKMVLDKAIAAKKKGIKVVSITREVDNSIGKVSDINFRIFDMNKLDDRNYYPNTFFPNACMLVEYLISRYFQEVNMAK